MGGELRKRREVEGRIGDGLHSGRAATVGSVVGEDQSNLCGQEGRGGLTCHSFRHRAVLLHLFNCRRPHRSYSQPKVAED